MNDITVLIRAYKTTPKSPRTPFEVLVYVTEFDYKQDTPYVMAKFRYETDAIYWAKYVFSDSYYKVIVRN